MFTFGAFVRRDQYNYYPSSNPFADLGPIQQETIGQNRTLTNAGLRSDLSYVKGIHNMKAGALYEHTLLTENFSLGIVDPGLNPVCLNADGSPKQPGFTDPAQCTGGLLPNPGFLPLLTLHDLTAPSVHPRGR